MAVAQAETFQNTTIIVVMDIAHKPSDAELVDKVSGRSAIVAHPEGLAFRQKAMHGKTFMQPSRWAWCG